WQIDGVHVDARFFLADDDALAARIDVHNRALGPRTVSLRLAGLVDAQTVDSIALTRVPCPHVVIGVQNVQLQLESGAHQHLLAVLARAADTDAALALGRTAFETAETVYTRLLGDDADFYAGCPTLSGDWPAHWRAGLHHDFETTRLVVQPPGGIF